MSISRRLSIAVGLSRSKGFASAWRHMLGHFAQWRTQRQFRWIRRSLSRQKERISYVLGSKMYLDPRIPGIEADLIIHGTREPAATGYLMHLLRHDDVILEAGANIGYYTLLCGRMCRRVYAVEPHPENFHRLERNVRLNGFENIELLRCAVGPTDQRVRLYCANASNCHTRIAKGSKPRRSVEVDEISIDQLVVGRERPTILRMDIEGYEYEALRGALGTLSTLRAAFIEMHCAKLSKATIDKTLHLLENAGLMPVVVIQFDHPGVSAVYGPEKIDDIRRGERSTFEIFLERAA